MNNKSKNIKRIISMILCLALIASVIHIENLKNIFNKEIPAIENETEEENTDDKVNQLLTEQQEYDESLEEVETKNVITSFTENDDIEITEDDAYILDEKMNDSVDVILNNEDVISIAFVGYYTLSNNYISEDGLYSCYEYEATLSEDFEVADNAGTPKVTVKLNIEECFDYENTNSYILENFSEIYINNVDTITAPRLYSSRALYAATSTSENVSRSYSSMVTSSSSGIVNKGAGLNNIYTKVGFLQFNIAGASNIADRRGADNKRSYIHVNNETIKALEENQNGENFLGNSSGCTLTQNDSGTTIKKAYLIIEYSDEKTIKIPEDLAKEYEHYAYPIKFAAYNKDENRYDYVKTYMKNRCYDDNWRCMSYIDVTDFVKDYGYTDYYCVNIPFNKDGLDYSPEGTDEYHNWDHYACWKLVVIEENKDLECPRYLRLKLGANAIDGIGGDSNTEYYAIDNVTLSGFKTPTKASLVSGEFMYSMAGADGFGNLLKYKYGSKDWIDIYTKDGDSDDNSASVDSNYRTKARPLVDRITRYNKFKKTLNHNYTSPENDADKYVKSGGDLDIVHISGTDEENSIQVGKNVKQLDFKFEIDNGYSRGLLLDMMAITVDIEIEYENEIESIVWDKTNNKYTVTGYSKCEYDTVSGYYNTRTVIEIPNGLKTTADDVTASLTKCSTKNVTVNDNYVIINWGNERKGIKKSASSSKTVNLTYCTFKDNRLDWSIVFYPSEDTTGYSLRKSTFKSWINADGIVSNYIRYANKIEKANKDTDSATVETLVINPAPGKWNSTTAASYYTWCVQNTTSSTDNGATKIVSNPTPPTGYVFEKWVATSNGNKTGQWNSTTKKFKYKYEHTGESKEAIDYTLTAKYKRSKSYLYANLKSYTTVGTGYQPVLASDWTASHHKWSVADTGGTSEDTLLHDTDGSTSHTLSKSSNHTSFEQVCTGYYNDWDDIPDPVPENYKLTLTYNGGWDDVDDATYQNPIRSYALGVSTDMTFDTSQGTGGWTATLGTDADFKNRVFTHGKTDNVTSYLTANWKGDYILTLPIVERWGYNFIGWYEQNADGTETLIDSTNTGIDIIMEKNRTFYAKWELITKDETINVKWLDNTNNYTTRPDSIYVELYRISGDDDGELCSKYITETLSTSSASWITRFSNETGFADASRGTKTSTIFDPNVYLTYTNASTNTKNSENNIFATDDGDYLIKISGNNSNPATSNTWTVTLNNLQKYDVTKENTEYVYVVKEVDCKSLDDTTQYYTSPKESTNNYSTAMSSYYNMDSYNEGPSGEQSLTAYDSIEPKDFSKTIVNRLGNSVMGVKPWKSVVVQIHYNDADDKYHFRPYSLKVQLYQNYANYKNTAKDNYLDDSGVRILYKTANAQMIKANAFSSTGNSAGFDAAAGLNWYFVRFDNVPTVEDSTGIKIAYDAILTYGQSRYRYTIDDTDEYNNLGQTIKNYGSSHYYSIKHQTGIQSIIDLDYTYITNGTNILTVGDTTTSTTIAKKDVPSKLEEGYYFIPDNMNDIFQSSNRYDIGLLTNDYDDTTFKIDTANQLIKYNDGKVGYAYPFSASYKSMAYNLRYYYITESNEMTALVRHNLLPYNVPDNKKSDYLFYTETLNWTFNVDLAGNNLTSLPEEYTGSNSADDRTGNYDGSIDDDYTHTNNKLTITSNVKNQAGAHIDAEDTAYKNLQIDQNQEAFLITLKQVKKNWTGSSDSIGESYTNNSYPANGYIYYNYDTSRNRLTRIFQPEATPINDERYTPVGNEYNVIVPANGSTTIEYLPDGKYEVTCHYDIDFSNFTYETTSGKTASIEKESDGKYYLTFSSATVPDEQAITQSETIDYWRGYVDDMNNFEWNRRLRNNNFDLVSGTPSNVKDKTLYPFGNNDEKNTISYETSTIKNVPNSYSVYENYTTKKYANKCPIHGTFLVNGKCTDESCSYSTYQYHSNGSNIVDDKLPYNVYLQYKGTETNTLK